MNPHYSVHTADKTSPRGFNWIWFLRLAEIVVSLIVLSLAARDIAGLSNSGCNVPGKMAWNLACAVLSLLALAYLLFSSGISQVFRILPWWIFIQIGLDALFFIFWIAAAGTSHFTCDDLCTACNIAGYEITYDSLVCACYSSDIDDFIFDKRGLSPNPNPGLSGGLQKRRSRYHSSGGATGTLVAREALDGVCVALFFVTFCSTAWWMWQKRRAGDNAAAATTTTTTNPNPENGVQQVPIEMKQDTPYTGGPAPQYTSVAPQNNYPPVSPANGQYPQQQGFPQQQQQSYPQQQPQGFPQQQQQSFSQQQQYPEQAPQGQGYYGGQQNDATPSPQAQQHDIPNYPTPTPEMQAEHGGPAH